VRRTNAFPLMPTSRRQFLTRSSLALAGVTLGLGRVAEAAPIMVPLGLKRPVSSLLPSVVDPDTLRSLALAGIDAAKSAGAAYADIRVSDSHRWRMDWSMPELQPLPYSDLYVEYGFGIRVRVGGAWGFAYGVEPTTDAIARAANAAVATARGIAKFTPDAEPFAPASAVQGDWASSFEIDPFSVSPDAHCKMLGAFIDAAQRVRDGSVYSMQFLWQKETRVFASSEGSLITQQTMRSAPKIEVRAKHRLRNAGVHLPVPGIAPASVGYESVLGTALQERIKTTTEEAASLISLPEADADVGRYEMVIDGSITGGMFASTLLQALDLGRALGQDADGAGTSFLAPVDDILGQQLFSPHLSATADRSAPHYGAVKWDDEGVPAESFPVIDKGRVVDYFGTRATVPALSAWYAKRGQSVRSRGSAVSWATTTSPIGAGSQITVTPGTPGTTLESMTKQLGKGLLGRGISEWSVSSDQQLSGGSFGPHMLFEVRNGQITRRLLGGMVQFRSRAFWKDLTMMGDASTVQSRMHTDYRGETYAKAVQPVLAPAARLASADIIQVGRVFL